MPKTSAAACGELMAEKQRRPPDHIDYVLYNQIFWDYIKDFIRIRHTSLAFLMLYLIRR